MRNGGVGLGKMLVYRENGIEANHPREKIIVGNQYEDDI